MFCVYCGAALEDDASFCTACGKAVEEPVVDAGDQQVQAPDPESGLQIESPDGAEQPTSKKPSRRIAIPVVIALVVVVAIAAVVFFVVLPNTGNWSASSGVGSPGVSASPNVSSDVASAAASSSSSQASGSSSSTSAASPSSTAPSSSAASHASSAAALLPDDLGMVNDANARGTINLFLSNFTEVALPDIRQGQTVSATALVTFAFAHDAVNSPQFIESAASAMTSDSGRTLTNYEATSRIDELASRYFGMSVNYGSLSADFAYRDNCVYFDPSQVVSTPQGVASVTGSEDLGGNRAKVYFNVYSGVYDATDQALYSGTQEEIMGGVGATAPSYSGVAIVRTGGNDERTGGMTLESFERAS